MRSRMTAASPPRRQWGEQVDRLLQAAYADEPRFRQAFLQVEAARPARKVGGGRECAGSERPLATTAP